MGVEEQRLSRVVPLTEREQKILNALIEHKSYKAAAVALGLKEGNLRNATLKIRIRYDNALSFIKECDRYQSYLPRKKRYVTG